MRRLLPISIGAIALVLFAFAESSASDERSNQQLFYFFSLTDEAQRERAVDLQRFVEPFGSEIEVTGVVRDGEETLVHHQSIISYELVTVDVLRARTSLAAQMQDHLDGEGVVLVRGGRIAAIGALSDLSRMLTQPLALGVATEIDESTWGKIKELFQ